MWFCSGGLCWLGGLFGPGAGVLWRFGFGFVAAAGSVGLSVVALFASLDTVSEIAYHCSEVHYGCDHSLRRSCQKTEDSAGPSGLAQSRHPGKSWKMTKSRKITNDLEPEATIITF